MLSDDSYPLPAFCNAIKYNKLISLIVVETAQLRGNRLDRPPVLDEEAFFHDSIVD
jgi:hypothetical protein